MNDWLQCVGNGLRRFVNGDFGRGLAGFTIIFISGLAIIATLAAFSGQWEMVLIYVAAMGIAAIIFFGIWFVLALLRLLVACGIAVIQRGLDAGAPGASTVVGSLIASGSITTCQSAQALLAQVQAALAAAQAARDSQAQRVTAASARVGNATNMLVAAAASAIAAIWQPWAILASLAALLSAIALLARRTRQLADEYAALSLREAELMRALADVAAAEALVATLCGTSPSASSGEDAGLLGGGRVPVSTTFP